MTKQERELNLQRMKAGEVYDASDIHIMAKQELYKTTVNRYNRTSGFFPSYRMHLLKKIFAECGKNVYVEPPFHANFGGRHVHVGNDFYANFNLTLVDDGEIHIGNGCMFGPNVTIITASHPTIPEERAGGLQFNKDVKIGNDVWLCSNVSILPGVTIGDGAVVAAGAVVNKDVPPRTLVAGVPAKIIRPLDNKN